MNRRHIIIGDIHGCFDEMQALLQRCEWNPAADTLISLGDLVHKGPKSLEAVRFFMEGGHQVILGNHEQSLLLALKGERASYPLKKELKKYFGKKTLINWLESMPLWIEGEYFLASHAGFLPWLDTPEEHEKECLISMRHVHLKKRKWSAKTSSPGEDWKPWYECELKLAPGKTLIFGHWASKLQRRHGRCLSLDRGCCYGGLLQAWIAEEERLLSVPSLQPKKFDY